MKKIFIVLCLCFSVVAFGADWKVKILKIKENKHGIRIKYQILDNKDDVALDSTYYLISDTLLTTNEIKNLLIGQAIQMKHTKMEQLSNSYVTNGLKWKAYIESVRFTNRNIVIKYDIIHEDSIIVFSDEMAIANDGKLSKSIIRKKVKDIVKWWKKNKNWIDSNQDLVNSVLAESDTTGEQIP